MVCARCVLCSVYVYMALKIFFSSGHNLHSHFLQFFIFLCVFLFVGCYFQAIYIFRLATNVLYMWILYCHCLLLLLLSSYKTEIVFVAAVKFYSLLSLYICMFLNASTGLLSLFARRAYKFSLSFSDCCCCYGKFSLYINFYVYDEKRWRRKNGYNKKTHVNDESWRKAMYETVQAHSPPLHRRPFFHILPSLSSFTVLYTMFIVYLIKKCVRFGYIVSYRPLPFCLFERAR